MTDERLGDRLLRAVERLPAAPASSSAITASRWKPGSQLGNALRESLLAAT